MTDKQRLRKGIEKAEKNGYKTDRIKIYCGSIQKYVDVLKFGHTYYALIFSPDFAKALWGEGYYEIKNNVCIPVTSATQNIHGVMWVYHQHQMLDVVQVGGNPLEYIEKFLT